MLFQHATALDLGNPHGEIRITESLNADRATVRYDVTGTRIDGAIYITPNAHDAHIIPVTVRVQFGEIDRRRDVITQPVKVDTIAIADTIIVDPRDTRTIPEVRRQDDTIGAVAVHPVPDSVHDHVALVVALLVDDRWIRRNDAPALRLTIACQTLALHHAQERDFYVESARQLQHLCSDVQARAERLELMEHLAAQHAANTKAKH